MGSEKKKKRRASEHFIYWAVRGFSELIGSLPLPLSMFLGRAVGWGVWFVDRRHRIVADENLRAAYGDSLSAEERGRIIRGVYRNLGFILIEMIKTPRVIHRHSWRRRIRVEGEENARAAAALGRGVIFVSGHIGNWELLGLGITLLGYPLHTLARPLDNALLDSYLLRARTRFGQRIVSPGDSFRSFLKILRDGGFIGVLADQNQLEKGVFVDFFGRKAATLRTVAALHRRTGAPIVTGYVRREHGSLRHRIRVDPAIICDRTPDAEGDIRRITQAFTSRVETYVRETPDQWLWLHRRWKTQPDGTGDRRRHTPDPRLEGNSVGR